MTYAPQPQPRPNSGRGPLIAIVVVLAVVLLAGGLTAVFLASGGRLPWIGPVPACGYIDGLSHTECTPPPEPSSSAPSSTSSSPSTPGASSGTSSG